MRERAISAARHRRRRHRRLPPRAALADARASRSSPPLAALEVFRLLPPAGFPAQPLPGVVFAPLAVLGDGLARADARAGWRSASRRVLIVLAIDAFRRPDVRDGFLAWLGGSFGALYPALLAFIAAILVVAPAIPGRRRRSAASLDAGRTLAARARAHGLVLRHVRLPRRAGPSSAAASSTTSRRTRPGAASSAGRSRRSSSAALLAWARRAVAAGRARSWASSWRSPARPATSRSRC